MPEPAKTLIVAQERTRRTFLVFVFSRSNKTILRVIPTRANDTIDALFGKRSVTKSERRATPRTPKIVDDCLQSRSIISLPTSRV